MVQRNAWAEIDLAAVRNNVQEAKKFLKEGTTLCAVVKANAYGHGAVPVAQAALEAGAGFLAVAITQEALELREAGIKAPILVLGTLPAGHAKTIVAYGVSQTVYTLEAAQALSEAAVHLKKKAKIHLGIETGMNRIGCLPCDLAQLVEHIAALPNIEIEGVFSHFATGDDADKTFAHEQFARFKLALDVLRKEGLKVSYKHIANSAVIGEMASTHLDMVRQGITLYGLWPSPEVEHNMKLQPVMTVKARVSYVKEILPGETVGYGRTYEAKSKRRIATLPIGYADGVSRHLSNKGYVVIRGKQAPIVGRVCMDQMMVDVTDIPQVAFGDEAIVMGGKEVSFDLIAQWMDTINYEPMCLITSRIPRIYINK
ncbi:MAG: alanine racemase [Acidaminococcaceae bacterium]|nr:alanine racemase [Acidaminococcaceae bacterium]